MCIHYTATTMTFPAVIHTHCNTQKTVSGEARYQIYKMNFVIYSCVLLSSHRRQDSNIGNIVWYVEYSISIFYTM